MSTYDRKPWIKRVTSGRSAPLLLIAFAAFIILNVYRLNSPTPVGTEIQDFKLKNIDGIEFNISEINQPIILVFYKKHQFFSNYMFNTYYRKLLPELKFLQDKGYAAVVVLSEGYDTTEQLQELSEDVYHHSLKKTGYTGDMDLITKYFGIRSFPHLFVLNKNKEITFESKLVSADFIKKNVLWR